MNSRFSRTGRCTPDFRTAPRPPSVSTKLAATIAREIYGIEAAAQPLFGDREANFRLDAADGSTYVLKIAGSDSRAADIEFHTGVLEFLERSPSTLPVPRVIRSMENRAVSRWDPSGDSPLLVYMLRWVDGAFIDLEEAPDTVRRACGRMLARLHRALKEYSTKGAPQDLPWDLRNTAALRGLVFHAGPGRLGRLVRDRLDHFERVVAPRLEGLPRQVIHNDFNPDNLLFAPDHPAVITGIIDFSDAVADPVICDLAVACAYQIGTGKDPVGDLLPAAEAYHAESPLDQVELALLPDLIQCRLIMTLLIQGQRAGTESDGDTRFAAASAAAAVKLRNLAAQDPGTIRKRLRERLA